MPAHKKVLHELSLFGRKVELRPEDFIALRSYETGFFEVKTRDSTFERLVAMKLATHRFVQKADWTVAVAALTKDGNEALRLEPTVRPAAA